MNLTNQDVRRALLRAAADVEPASAAEIQRVVQGHTGGAVRLVVRDHCVVDAYTDTRLSEANLWLLVKHIRREERRYLRAGKVIEEKCVES